LLVDPGTRFFYFNISFTFAATATPSFLSDSAVRCKPSTPSVEINRSGVQKFCPAHLGNCFIELRKLLRFLKTKVFGKLEM
jgi:hypothetical protein